MSILSTNPLELTVFSEWIQIGSVVVAVIFGLYRVRKTLDTRDNETEKRLMVADSERTEILAEITALTIRVDRIADTLDRVDRNTHQVAVELARQSGQLEEHLHSPRSG